MNIIPLFGQKKTNGYQIKQMELSITNAVEKYAYIKENKKNLSMDEIRQYNSIIENSMMKTTMLLLKGCKNGRMRNALFLQYIFFL